MVWPGRELQHTVAQSLVGMFPEAKPWRALWFVCVLWSGCSHSGLLPSVYLRLVQR